ncbi:MAG: adenylyltransferase/cytidyltransferase family protein [Patescibacteria group bacterium]
MKNKKVVAISGYFNPIHVGHINYIQAARKLGDYLVVIINNDKQVKLKGSVPFMKDKDRLEIIKHIKGVDKAVLAIDKDKTVCQSLRKVKPDIFANGGDRKKGNVPESPVCNELNIKMVYGVGGGKIQSSSTLLKKVIKKK